jgi:hypothetical protein
MKSRVSLLFVFVLFLAVIGCQGLQPSFGDGLGAAYLAVDTAAATIKAECGNTVPDGPCAATSSITTAEKQKAKHELTDALVALDRARELYAIGDVSGAANALDTAHVILSALEEMMNDRH